MSQPFENTKINELESIRGIAAFLIVLVHIPYPVFGWQTGLVKNGYLMVELFFVLSGFVIYNAYEGKINSKSDFLRFQFLRFGRLYPVHLLFLIVFLIFEVMKYIATTKFGISSPNAEPFSQNNLKAFVQQLFLVQALDTGNITTFNGPAWSISVEFYTYIVFGLVLLFANKFKTLVFIVLVFSTLGLMIFNKLPGYFYFLQCIAGFFIGCLTAQIARIWQIKISSHFSLIVFLSLVLFLIFKPFRLYDSIIFVLSALLIFTLLKSDGGILNKTLNNRALTWLGMVSYSLYMSHSAVLWVVNNVLRLFVKRPEILDVDGKLVPNLTVFETLAIYGLIFAMVLALSWLTYKCVETPFREKSRALNRNQFKPA